jgi:serine protease Do
MTELDADLAALAQQLRRSTVQVASGGGHGSGLIATPDGTLLTNAHVANARTARVIFDDGGEVRGAVSARAPELDLAVITVPARGLPAVTFRDAATLRPGDILMAAGNPLDLVGAVTTGIVHSTDRRGRRVAADLRLLPGNSGGPLADVHGRVVGVNAMVVDGLAVAISSAVVERFLRAPLRRPYLGVVTRPVVVDVMGERRLGLLVTEVAERSAATHAHMRPGLIVIGVDGRLFSAPGDLFDEIESSSAGAHLRLDVIDGGRVGGIDVIIGETARRADAA